MAGASMADGDANASSAVALDDVFGEIDSTLQAGGGGGRTSSLDGAAHTHHACMRAMWRPNESPA